MKSNAIILGLETVGKTLASGLEKRGKTAVSAGRFRGMYVGTCIPV